MDKYTLSEINIYPVKSLGGISLKESKVERRGLQFDRRWMLVGKDDNMFITQREINELCLFRLNFDNAGFKIKNNKAGSSVSIPYGLSYGETCAVTVWDSICEAIHYSDEIDKWFSDIIGYDCKLVYMPDTTDRKVNEDFAVDETDVVSFADGYPILIIGQSSLDNYNNISGNSLKMNRFRPNFVFSGGEPHIEDTWKKFSLNELNFYSVKPCGRCVITTVEQETGIAGKEPLKTLAAYRTINNSIKFGMNLIPHKNLNSPLVKVGSEIKVLETN